LIHRPNYGVGIKRFQNAPTSIATQRRLALKIKEQCERDRRVESLLGVKIIRSDLEPSKSILVIRVKPVGYGETEFKFSVFGEVA
jgi:hypothetical protein